jgi:hypothetical protein
LLISRFVEVILAANIHCSKVSSHNSSISIMVIFLQESLYIICYRIYRMCEFIGSFEDIKLLKRRMNKLAEEEPELEKLEEQPLVASK